MLVMAPTFTSTQSHTPDVVIKLVEESSSRSLSVSFSPDPNWESYLKSITEPVGRFSIEHIEAVRDVWAELTRTVNFALITPITQPTAEGAIQLAWNSERYYFDIDIYPDGRFHWYFRDRQSGEVDGSDEDAIEPPPPAEMFARLRSATQQV